METRLAPLSDSIVLVVIVVIEVVVLVDIVVVVEIEVVVVVSVVAVKSPTNKIILNAFDIVVEKANLQEKDTGKLQAAEITTNVEDEKVEFSFPEVIKAGDYSLQLEFTGVLNDQLRGFYRNKYKTADGEVRYAAGTHFEATGARRAYPCWDEPAIKAKFVFTLIVPKDRVAVSNMPVEKEEPSPSNPNLKVLTFAITPTMSTYLTAFVVGEYDFVEDKTPDGTPVRVYTPVGQKEQGLFALEVATRSLPYYEWYFNVPYGLPKLDLITLTEFPIGAMENWGLVTYRESCLLVDPVSSSAKTRNYVALIVAHELSHNWFGNLVTMNWWTDLWLKEGFATWIEYQCVDALYPEFNVWSQFIKDDQSRALRLDALSNSHPVEVQVGHPAEIDEIFDTISYQKGASLIRMLQAHIGNEAFRKGMTLYLTRHQFSNSRTSDMWAAMEEASGTDVASVMDTWTSQMGFPLVKVEETIQPDSTVRTVKLSQRKFSSQADSVPSNSTWKVPFSVTTSHSPSTPVIKGLLEGASISVQVPDCKPGDWIKVNPNQSMFYHVQYEPDSLTRLMPAMRDGVLPPEDRIGLLTDLFALARANCMDMVDVLRVSTCFREETNFAVSGKLAAGLSGLSPLVQQAYQGKKGQFPKYTIDTFSHMGQKLGWDAAENETHANKLMREQVLTRLGSAGHEETKAEAFKRFEDHCNGSRVLSGDIRTPVYVTVLTHGDQAVFDRLMKFYEDEDSTEEKTRIGHILGVVQDRELKSKVLQFSLSDKVRNQDSVGILAGVTGSLEGRQLLWEFVQANWPELHRRYATSTMLFRLAQVLMDGVACAKTAKEMEAFFKIHEAKSAERAIKQGLENIASNVAFLEKQGASILQFLDQQ
ncbi:puromycin-sensitive aminopeptidase [Elysia marginata]|uniref:Aminopeptidase n=1 Tax=Elysia marginata TaxID=1093978 RepID=A0AAV4FX97_9GAST|nr:puromycin-sensitive aminopeptidase [Elysia marginata]